MRGKAFITSVVVAIAAICVAAQDARGGSASVDALLQTALDAKTSHAGDPVTANVLLDMKAADGRVIIPRGSMFSGKVVAATPRSESSNRESSLEITFDRLKLSNGQEYPIAATVKAVQLNVPKDSADTPTIGLGAPAQAMSGTTSGGVTSQIASGDRTKGAVIAETTENYQIGKAMPPNATGVHGAKNVTLNAHDANTVLTSSKADVKVPSGSQLLLVVRNR